MSLDFFFTAYDPLDLPGGSVDPLGFDRSYGFLADKILPGLTNVASVPRYFGVLCLGAFSAEVDSHDPPVRLRAKREEAILRLERCWALANVLASGDELNDNLYGLRGVTYAKAQIERIKEKGYAETKLDFRLLSRQKRYGVIGIYGRVAEEFRLLSRNTLKLELLGEKLANAFLDETSIPESIKRAVKEEDIAIPVADLRKWGERAHLRSTCGKVERECFSEMLHLDTIRSRFCHILEDRRPLHEETELQRLARIEEALAKESGDDQDLRESVSAILKYERCYQLVLLAFERLLWLCRTDPTGAVSFDRCEADIIMISVLAELPRSVQAFDGHVESCSTGHFRDKDQPLKDILTWLRSVKEVCDDGFRGLIREILGRHQQVQHGKSDKGLRKMPWIEESGGALALTNTRVGGLDHEVKEAESITPHPYRLAAADAYIRAASTT
ncbi:MAG: hypothetical protein ACLQPD_31115 [Desulfomonilaceae bacterium]